MATIQTKIAVIAIDSASSDSYDATVAAVADADVVDVLLVRLLLYYSSWNTTPRLTAAIQRGERVRDPSTS